MYVEGGFEIESKERYWRQLVLESLRRVLLQREQRNGAVAEQRLSKCQRTGQEL